jgi:hypothetical protein
MNAPPISESTFMVDEARNAMVDEETGIEVAASAEAAPFWPAHNVVDNAVKPTSAKKPVEYDRIPRLERSQNQIKTDN